MSDHDPGVGETQPSAASPTQASGVHGSAIQQALPIYYGLLFALLTACGLLLLWWLSDVLLLLFISVLFAAAVSRPSAYLERIGIPRGIAALLVYLVSFAILVGIGWFVVPPTVSQIAALADDAPDHAERYDRLRTAYDELAEKYPSLGTFDEQVGAIQERIINSVGARLLDIPTRLFSPFVEGDQLDIPPLLVFVAVLVGAALLGPAGALVAVPAAATVQVVFEEVIIPWRRWQLAPAEAAIAGEHGSSVVEAP